MSPYHHGDLPAALLRAAEAIIERDGIKALTLRAAAREAGVSHAAPLHHFGDLVGLLSELAASGFTRLREHIAAEIESDNPSETARSKALGHGYVGFAEGHPGLFQLMFRAERLDWTRPSLARAGTAAFALLAGSGQDGDDAAAHHPEKAGSVMAQWSLVHGLAMLIIDGRLDAVAAKMFRTDARTVRDHVLDRCSGLH